MGVDFDVLEYCRKLRTSNKPPYTCPVVECGKPYKSMCGLQYHLVNYDHNSPQTPRTPNTSVAVSPKKSKLSYKFFFKINLGISFITKFLL